MRGALACSSLIYMTQAYNKLPMAIIFLFAASPLLIFAPATHIALKNWKRLR
ncbi:MAG: hypothetical protein R3C11_15185 [Planctomycetaceae bacterium]